MFLDKAEKQKKCVLISLESVFAMTVVFNTAIMYRCDMSREVELARDLRHLLACSVIIAISGNRLITYQSKSLCSSAALS